MLLALYGNAHPLIDSFQPGRLPNTAPVAACLPPSRLLPGELEAWLSRAHQAGAATPKSLTRNCGWRHRHPRPSYEVTLRAPAETRLTELNRIHDAWSLAALEAAANQFQYDFATSNSTTWTGSIPRPATRSAPFRCRYHAYRRCR